MENKLIEDEPKWEIELSDGERKIVTTEELLQMEKNAEEFDGFYGWRVIRKIPQYHCSCGNEYGECEIRCKECPAFQKYKQQQINRWNNRAYSKK